MNLVINESQPLWEYLRCAEKPVVLYGMGDGALKILAVCRQYGIPIAGIFASDEFVRGHSFEGYPVESLAQIEERLGDFIVLLCFGVDYDSMLERIAELSRRHEARRGSGYYLNPGHGADHLRGGSCGLPLSLSGGSHGF